ncbi:hypothetical protein ABLU29_00275 (plasmid) [Lactococcus lactis]|uniref:hypothetical protein n=1 Tax=Lactococcus lactis TaxID=1358 RepID=UPI0033143F08
MKNKIIVCGFIVVLCFILTSCGTNNERLKDSKIDKIDFSLTNDSIKDFEKENIFISRREVVSSIKHLLGEVDYTKENEVNNTENLVGANTYTLDLSRGTKFIERYQLYGDFIKVGVNKKHQKIYKVSHKKISKLVQLLDVLVENNDSRK